MKKFKFNIQRFALNANRVMSGTHGSLWLNGEYLAEVKGFEARVEVNKEDVPVVGRFMQGSKAMSAKGTGTLRLHKTNSRMANLMGDALKTGYNPEFEALSSLNDPAAFGAERVMIKGITFDDLTLSNWEAGALGEIECPFTFDDFNFVDKVDNQ